jgi:uncharacterized protein YjeT (DUF2065 family)
MKKDKIIFWITTSLIFVFEGLLPAFTSQSDMAKEGISHLGYPGYFGTMLAVAKVLGAIVLISPRFSKQVKEWAYAGFAFDFIAAFVSLWAVDGFNGMLVAPAIFMGILVVSYKKYHKLNVVLNASVQS